MSKTYEHNLGCFSCLYRYLYVAKMCTYQACSAQLFLCMYLGTQVGQLPDVMDSYLIVHRYLPNLPYLGTCTHGTQACSNHIHNTLMNLIFYSVVSFDCSQWFLNFLHFGWHPCFISALMYAVSAPFIKVQCRVVGTVLVPYYPGLRIARYCQMLAYFSLGIIFCMVQCYLLLIL